MSDFEKVVGDIEGVNPYDITPAECKLWMALTDTLVSTGVVRAETGEIKHTVTAYHKGTGRTQEVTIFIKI